MYLIDDWLLVISLCMSLSDNKLLHNRISVRRRDHNNIVIVNSRFLQRLQKRSRWNQLIRWRFTRSNR